MLASPAIRSIQDFYGPDRTTVVVVPRALPLVPMLGIEAPVITFELNRVRWPRPLLYKASRRTISQFIKTVHALNPDLVINLHEIGSLRGLLSFLFLMKQLGPAYSIGRGYRGLSWPFRHVIPERELSGLHNVDRYLKVVTLAGAPPSDSTPIIHLAAPPENLPSIAKPYLCINPGGYTAWKRWPSRRFAEVGSALLDRFESVIILGSREEMSASAQIADAIGTAAISLAGRLDLKGLAHILAGAEMLITNNSGPMHMAAALQIPTVAIFGNLPADTLHPFLPADRYRVLTSLNAPFFKPIRAFLLPLSLRYISTPDVLSAVESLYSGASR